MKSIEVFLKNLLLSILLVFNKTKNVGNQVIFDQNTKILFIRLNRIGDALVSTPLIHVVKKEFKCTIHLLADKKNHFVFSNNRDIDKILINQKGLRGFLEILKKINSENYDVIVDLHDDVSTTVSFLTALSNAPNKFALNKENSKIFTNTIERPNSKIVHVVDRIMQIAKLFDIDTEEKSVNIQYTLLEKSLFEVEKYLSEHITSDKPLLGINISAGSDARFWGIERFQKLMLLLNNYSFNPIILTDLKDLEKAESISQNQFPIYYSRIFDNFCAMISKCSLIFTPDTSIVHIASAFEIPLFGLYVKYNTEDMIWSPYKSKFDCVITEEPNFDNLDYNIVETKFKQFLENLSYNYSIK